MTVNAIIGGMDCLTYCVRGMNQRFVDFATGQKGLRFLRVVNRTTSDPVERAKELIVFYNSNFLTEALTMLNLGADTIEVVSSDEFLEFYEELRNTVNENIQLLLSKLNRQQRRQLQKAITG